VSLLRHARANPRDLRQSPEYRFPLCGLSRSVPTGVYSIRLRPPSPYPSPSNPESVRAHTARPDRRVAPRAQIASSVSAGRFRFDKTVAPFRLS